MCEVAGAAAAALMLCYVVVEEEKKSHDDDARDQARLLIWALPAADFHRHTYITTVRGPLPCLTSYQKEFRSSLR